MVYGRPFDIGETAGYYYGILVHANLMTEMQVRKSYGVGVMSVTLENVFTWAFVLPETFLESTEKEKSA